jgi:ubiquinone/menaquinone biosynthesis C-methylase UbiE
MNSSPFDYGASDIDTRYDRGRALPPAGKAMLLEFLRKAAPRKVTRVLDLGGGTGRFSGILAEAFGVPVVVIEPAANMIGAAAGKWGTAPIRFVRGSAMEIPVEDSAFDCVFVSQVLHHLADLDVAMTEARRVLTAGGRLIVRQTTAENLDSYFYQRFFPGARAVDQGRLPSRGKLIASAAGAGFTVDEVTPVLTEVAPTSREYVEKISTRTNSDLALISESEFEEGLVRLCDYCRENPGHPRSEEVDHFLFTPDSKRTSPY